MLLTKEVTIKPNGKMIQYYKDLGYDAVHNSPLMINIKDLSKGSGVPIKCLCDYCHEEILTMPYNIYISRTKEINKMACKKCSSKKVREISLLRYGVDNYAKTQECHKKIKDTFMARYGVEHNSQLPSYKEKYNQTCIERYGKSYRKQFVEKAFETFYKKTGYNNPTQSPEVQAKVSQTFYMNGTTPTSKQQFYIFNLYQSANSNIQLNYPIAYYNADICIPDEMIDIEIDFGGHNLSVKTGKITQEEFNQKEIIRNNIIKREGYKQMRIISSKDLLPSDQILLQMLFEAKQYFCQYPQHSWIEFNIDISTICNAEYKDGIPYDYGILRTIK